MIFFAVTSIILSIALIFSIRKNLELLSIFEDSAEDFEEILKDLSFFQSRIEKKSKLELFLDDPVTRELVEEIKGTKKVVIRAAEKISVFLEDENEKEG